MTKISRIPIEPKYFDHYVNNLWSAFSLMNSKGDIRLLFKDLFTHTEYKMFAKRLEIARRLLEGQTYEEIIEHLKVTPRTINSISTVLALQGEGLRKAHQKLNELDQKYQDYRDHKQKILERKERPKLAGEEVLPNLLRVGINKTARAIAKTAKRRSARNELKV